MKNQCADSAMLSRITENDTNMSEYSAKQIKNIYTAGRQIF